MKVKYIWAILIALSFFGCDDNTEGIGLNMFPEEDRVDIISKEYDVFTKSILANSVYARTDTAYLGKYNDEQFGPFEASFLSQLNCLDSLKFPGVYGIDEDGIMVKDETLSTEIILSYNRFFGDSVAPHHISIYELNKKIEDSEEIHYSNIDVEEYFDRTKGPIGQANFTAGDLAVSDSIKNLPYYEPQVHFELSKSLGDKILKLNREHQEYFYDNKSFIDNVFKGIYAECDQGSGAVLYINRVALNVKYECYELDSLGNILETKDGLNDSIIINQRSFVATREVYQLNKLQLDSKKLEEKAAEDNHTFIKSPAGIFTEVILPIEEIIEESKINNDSINTVKLQFESYLNEDISNFHKDKPKYLLLIEKNEIKTFFEENKIPDNITSYVATLDNGNYIFPNIARLIQALDDKKNNQKKKDNDEWNKMVLIPVTLNIIEEQGYGGIQQTIIGVRHNLKPEHVKLERGIKESPIKLKVIYTSFNNELGL